MYQVSLQLGQFSVNYNEDKFRRILNSIELFLVGRVLGHCIWYDAMPNWDINGIF